MTENWRDRFVQNNPWQIILLAVVILAIGQSILVWQYRRLEGGRIEELEREVEEQRQTMEERAAQESLRTFLEARIAGDKNKVFRYVTERAQLELAQEVFEFARAEGYAIQEGERLEETVFRFRVEITRDRLKQIEFIEVRKIGGTYYVDSIQPAG